MAAGLRLGQHARALDRIEGEVGAGFLLQLETMPPGGEFVGPGLDGIDITAGLVRHERSAPAVVAVMDHRRAAPFPVLLAAPDHGTGNDVMAVAVDIGPYVNALADDALHGIAAAVDQRENIFDMESTAGRGALDSLSCFVHGDATELLTILETEFLEVPSLQTRPRFTAERHMLRTYIESLCRALVPAGTGRMDWS